MTKKFSKTIKVVNFFELVGKKSRFFQTDGLKRASSCSRCTQCNETLDQMT